MINVTVHATEFRKHLQQNCQWFLTMGWSGICWCSVMLQSKSLENYMERLSVIYYESYVMEVCFCLNRPAKYKRPWKLKRQKKNSVGTQCPRENTAAFICANLIQKCFARTSRFNNSNVYTFYNNTVECLISCALGRPKSVTCRKRCKYRPNTW